ncbi:L,D-transpeptidase [Amycolatopsis australiensis]|uniref:Lipoprotein-anchoring transpeptidase ErfK/SrfK n=1 Tax=Amycolatopsis australiensis TaxID=546364 RepID=A0A1K1PNF5_9PSEU|nr:Ig-like domain-containing protein [Amycolatopsis australiensis]SFW49290.1 Lipoprotein-anchoring transpeptidase ErfK/SrfK [Amycolatopsis australiensis]
MGGSTKGAKGNGLTVRTSTRRRGAAVALGLAAVLTLGACSSEPTVSASGTSGGGPTQAPAPTAQPAKLTVTPAAGAQDVPPGEPVGVQVADGTIVSVTLTNPDGKQVQGQTSADKKSWTTTEQLGYGKTYTWSGQISGSDGKNVPISGAFTTVKPKRQMSASLNVGDGQTYGIAMPIALTFPSRVTDKASVEKALSVETTPKTEGSWGWTNGDTSVHWRPKEYYKPGTTVKVNAKIYGVKLGDGSYGKQDVSASFTIGRSQIVKGNTQEHTMQVIRDGQQIADYPVSYGLDTDPGRVTHSGVHVVMGKQATYAMSNPKYHYENVVVPWAVRISNNGEFIHGLAASVWAQGKKNISHGCLNLSPARAKEYYDGVLTGDPVEITGSTQTLSAKDGDYSDWTYDWASWQKLSALAG